MQHSCIEKRNINVRTYYHIDMERYAAFAGSWYPADRKELDEYIRPGLFGTGDITDAILPHAGLYYSARIIRQFFQELSPGIKRIVIISPSHYFRLPPGALCTAPFTFSATPYGSIETIPLNTDGCISSAPALQREHGVEMFLPFIKAAGLSVSYALINEVTGMDNITDLVDSLINMTDESTGFIASSDFTHYGHRFGYTPYGVNAGMKVKEHDSECARLLSNMETEEVLRRFTDGTICGIAPAMIASAIARHKRRHGSIGISYTSDDISGISSDDFVSYQSVLWRE